jgi:hypothetical protein
MHPEPLRVHRNGSEWNRSRSERAQSPSEWTRNASGGGGRHHGSALLGAQRDVHVHGPSGREHDPALGRGEAFGLDGQRVGTGGDSG